MVECYIEVDVGTLYYAVRQLEKDQLIETVMQERVPRGGLRTIYRITQKGRDEFLEGLHQQFGTEGPVSQTLYGALLFLHLADRSSVEDGIRRKIARLDELIGKLRQMRAEFAPVISTGGKHLLGHIEQQRQLDRTWLQTLLADIEANGISDVADPSKLGPD